MCAGSSITLTGSGASSYSWTGGVSDGVSFVPSNTKTYTVTGTDANNCSNTATTTIHVNSLPVVIANASANILCGGNSVTLTGSGASSYSWSGGVSDGVSFVPTSSKTYTVTGTDANNCSNKDTTRITVNSLSSSTVTANSNVNPLCSGGSVTLTGSGANSYAWTGGINDGVPFSLSSTTTFTVTGTDNNGCTNTDTITIHVKILPTVTANTSSNTVCAGASVTLTGQGASNYLWTGGVTDGISFNPISTKTYTVIGTDASGCINTTTKTIHVNTLPIIPVTQIGILFAQVLL